MHMADALVAPAVAGTMYLCSTAAAGISIKKVKLENEPPRWSISRYREPVPPVIFAEE